MAATRGALGSAGSGRSAFAHSARTLPGVSWPSSVVRSIIEIARSIAQALAVVLIERVERVAPRASAPTWSTPGSPCRNRRRDASDAVISDLRSTGSAAVVVTAGVYRRAVRGRSGRPARSPPPTQPAQPGSARQARRGGEVGLDRVEHPGRRTPCGGDVAVDDRLDHLEVALDLRLGAGGTHDD